MQSKTTKLTLKKFGGDITLWSSFWDSLESSIHNNPDLTELISSTTYIHFWNTLLLIPGLTLSSSNYEEAIALLKKRFGCKQQLISKHMEALLNLEAVTSSRDLTNLRQLYDKVESHVRWIESLDITSASYGSLLSSILMKKIPQDLCLIVSREIFRDEWDLDSLMKVNEKETEAREELQWTPV